MDLHCHIRPDLVRTVQFLDDLRLEVSVPPTFELRLLRNAIWRDEPSLPVEVHWHGKEKLASFVFRLIDGKGKTVKEWRRRGIDGVLGLEFAQTRLLEGRYTLHCEAVESSGKVIATTTSTLEVALSPWEGAKGYSKLRPALTLGEKVPEGFTVLGTVAPTDLPDFVPSESEPISQDLDLTQWQQKGYVVFTRHWLDNFSRLSRPLPGEIGTVRVFASPGEYEPAVVLV